MTQWVIGKSVTVSQLIPNGLVEKVSQLSQLDPMGMTQWAKVPVF